MDRWDILDIYINYHDAHSIKMIDLLVDTIQKKWKDSKRNLCFP